jgi:hypothetical protein
MLQNNREAIMKLYEVPRNSRIRFADGSELNFDHIDGMYSYCTDDEGHVFHISAFAEVEIVQQEIK